MTKHENGCTVRDDHRASAAGTLERPVSAGGRTRSVRPIAELAARSRHIRRQTLELGTKNGGYHFGGSFSATEILIALYDVVMDDADTFIFSKGHACWPWYVLLRELGYQPELAGHPSLDAGNGITCTTGSEGHGLPIGIGMAMARKRLGRPGRIYVLVGDGECQEGTTWESMLVAAHHGLDNLVAIVDYNGIQGSGYVNEILPLRGLSRVAMVLGWSVVEIDGHSYPEVIRALREQTQSRPSMIVANTIKGKGVSYMENRPEWHAKFPSPEELARAHEELE